MPDNDSRNVAFRTLPTLPEDINMLIIEELAALDQPLAFKRTREAQIALLALTLTSKSFRQLAELLLYRHIYIDASRLKDLTKSLRPCDGNFNSPSQTTMARYIKSLCITASTNSSQSPNDAGLEDLIYNILSQNITTLERVCLHPLVGQKVIQLFHSMTALKALIVRIGYLNRLHEVSPQVEDLAIFIPPSTVAETAGSSDLHIALKSCTNLKRLMIANIDVIDFSPALARSLVTLFQCLPQISYVITVPHLNLCRLASYRLPEALVLECFERELSRLDSENPNLLIRSKKLVRIARVPLGIEICDWWMRGKFEDGTAWDMETSSYDDIKSPPSGPMPEHNAFPGASRVLMRNITTMRVRHAPNPH